MDTQGIKIRVLRSVVIAGTDADSLEAALTAFYDEHSEEETEMVSMIRVADFAVLITYTG